MYSMNVNVAKQRIEIMRGYGEPIAFCPFPSTRLPNPGREVLMTMPGNQEAYDLIHDLVADANDGCDAEK